MCANGVSTLRVVALVACQPDDGLHVGLALRRGAVGVLARHPVRSGGQLEIPVPGEERGDMFVERSRVGRCSKEVRTVRTRCGDAFLPPFRP